MLERFLSVIAKIDLLGQPIQFKIRGNDKFKTPFGGILSGTIIVLVILLSITFLLELINRSNPSVSLSTSLSSGLKIDLNNKFPIIFYVTNNNAFPFPQQDKLFEIIGYSINFNTTANSSTPINQYVYFNITLCSKDYIESNYGEYADLFFKSIPSPIVNSNVLFCLNLPKNRDSYIIDNSFGKFPFQYIQFSFAHCNNKTKNNTCKSTEEIINTLSNGQVTILTPDIYLDHNNYTSPGVSYINIQTFVITSSLYKRFFIYLKSISYFSDNGIILSNIMKYTYFQIDKVNQEVSLPGVATFIPNVIANFCFTLQSNVFNIYTRQFLSIPQLLANLGGAYNSLMIICLMINYFIEKVVKEIEVLDICCTESLIKQNLKAVEKIMKTDNLQENNFKTNNYLFENTFEKSKGVINHHDSLQLKNQGIKNFEFSKKSIIFDHPEIEKLLQINFNFLQIVLPCIRSNEQRSKVSLAERFSNQVFEIDFILGNLLENQLFNLLNLKN